MNLSFAGCGFLGIYHVGVAVCFKKYAPHLLLDKISGASVGALAATCLLCDMPLVREPAIYNHSDGKTSNGLTPIPWKCVKPLVLGYTNADTSCCQSIGSVARISENSKRFKCAILEDRRNLIEEMGKKLKESTDENKSESNLHQRVSICNRPGNTASVLGEMTSDFFRIVNEARSHSLGPFSPSFNIQTCLLEGLQKFLPLNAHELVSGRLHISLTRVYDGKNVIVSKFNSREELLQALLCACFIPGFSGLLPPRFQGVRYMDGAFSDNLPILDENTITVSPFCGESDICPRDETAQLYHVNWANTSIELSRQNINRFGRILFPPKPEVLSDMCQQGFDGALNYLHRNNLINCTRCLAVQSTFIVQESVQDSQDYDPECKECIKHRKDALIDDMPETVLTVFQTYIESANKLHWIFKHRGAKLLKTLSLPATLPADFVCATLTKLLLITNNVASSYVGDMVERREFRFMVLANIVKTSQKIPKFCFPEDLVAGNLKRVLAATPCIKDQLHSITKYILNQLDLILSRKKRQKMTTNISCQLSLTECGIQKSKHLTHRSSKVDVLFNENEIQTTIDNFVPTPYTLHDSNGVDVDTFEHILEVTSEHEAVYAYYYMDENNKVKVTEIFDMTDSDSPEVQTVEERETNQQLQFDTEWDGPDSDFLYAEHHKRNTMIDIGDLNEDDLFENSINETLLEIEELASNDSGEISS